MFEAPGRSSRRSCIAPAGGVPRTGRKDAELAIEMLGQKASMLVPTETLLHFGQWLGWPDWLRDGTGLSGTGPLPPKVPLGDGLIMFGNILDMADYLALFERILTSPRYAIGTTAALQLLHAPDMGTALSASIRAVATPNPWMICRLDQGEGTAEISLRPAWPMGPLFEFLALGGAALFYRAIEAFRPNDISDMIWETQFHDEPRAQHLLSGFHCQKGHSVGLERLRFSKAWLATPNPHYDPAQWSVACAELGRLVIETGEAGAVASVRAFIVYMLEKEQRAPRLKQAAAQLGISTRTVVRVLAREGTSFHRLLEEERKSRALVLLGDPSLSLADIARLLGFTDMPSFSRSCRAWFGDTPGHLRRRYAKHGDPV